jgi:fructokinase
MIVVAGEALIDRIVQPDGSATAVPGGGPYNVARTIARLGGTVAFLGRVSADPSGRALRSALEDDHVDLRFVVSTDAPTTVAVAELDLHGSATYRFDLAGTSAPGLDREEVRVAVRSRPAALHVGSLGLMVEPIAAALASGIGELDHSSLLMVDPNCRPDAIDDRDAYLARLLGILARAHVVKASVDDLAYMAPGVDAVDAARALVGGRAPVVVFVTDGPRPVRVIGDTFELELTVPRGPVVDTVGAGDAFGGGFLARWIERGRGPADLADPDAVRDAVAVAIEVAALTCARPGADPPHRSEVARLAG